MEEISWEDFAHRQDIVKMDHLNYVLFRHPRLKHIGSLYWNHEDHILTLSKISNSEIELQDKEVLELVNFNFVMLNFRDDGYRRLLKVNVDEASGSLNIDNIIPPDLNCLNFAIISV